MRTMDLKLTHYPNPSLTAARTRNLVELLDHATTPTEWSATASFHFFNPHCLDVGELPDSVCAQLPTVARPLHSSERDARIRGYHAVDEYHSRFQIVDKALA